MSRPAIRWIVTAIALSPAVVLALFIGSNAIDFPFADQWDPGISGLFIKAHNGELRLTDLWTQHNEHRMFIPKAAMLILGLMTRWNTLYEYWLNWVLASMTSLGLLLLLRRTFVAEPSASEVSERSGDSWNRVLILWFVLNLFVFSIRQWENWLTGIGIANIMIATWVVTIVVVATSNLPPVRRAILTGVCAVGMTITSGNGLLAWPLGALLLGICASRREFMERRFILLGWLIAFILMLAVYFTGYTRPPPPTDLPPDSGGFFSVLLYPIAFVGAPFASGLSAEWITTTMVAGILQCLLYAGLVWYCFQAWRQRRAESLWRRMIPWLVLGLFALASGIVASPMRARLGLAMAASSRYTTFAMFMPVALAVLIPLVCEDLRRNGRPSVRGLLMWTQAPAFLLGGILLLEFTSNLAVLRQYESFLYQRYSIKAGTLLLNVFPGNRFIQPSGFPNHPGTEDRARELNRLGYLRPPLIETRDASALAAPGAASPDPPKRWGALEGIQRTQIDGQIVASGWAIAPDSVRPADLVMLTLVDTEGRHIMLGPGSPGAARMDVVTHFGDRRYLNAGWSMTGTFPSFAPGTRFTLTVWSLNSTTGKTHRLGGEAIYER